MKLARTKQCAKCPWKCSTNPYEIPGDYTPEKHANLIRTIAVPGDYSGVGQPVRRMSCHDSYNEQPYECVGWLHHQLTIGNNIPLRFEMRNYENVDQIQVFGEQHKKFEDTLPKSHEEYL